MSRVIEFLKNFVKMKYLKIKSGKQYVNVTQGFRPRGLVWELRPIWVFSQTWYFDIGEVCKDLLDKAVGGDESTCIQPYDTEEPK